MTRLWRWALTGMICYVAGLTIWLAAFGDLSEEFGMVVFGTAISLAGIFLLTLKAPVE